MKKNCNHCGKLKDEEEFNWRYKSLGIRHKTCRECQHKHQDNWYQSHKETHLGNVKERKEDVRARNRQWVWEYLSTHPCIECGERDPMVLEFHHRHGKTMAVGQMVSEGYPLEKIQAEISKCDVLCANCHRRLTMKERGWFRGKK